MYARWGDFSAIILGTIRDNMNLFYTWASILGPSSPAPSTTGRKVIKWFLRITVALLISTAMTALLIKPWANLEKSGQMTIH